MNKQTLLIVEDDKDISNMLAMYLSDIPDIEILQAISGETALEIFEREKPKLLLLDIALPRMSGYEVLQKIKDVSNVPVIIISAMSQDNETILGLNLGADDYITKPFNPLVVVARVKAQLRRFQATGVKLEGILRAGSLTLDTTTCSLQKGGQSIELTYTEYKLLKHLMEYQRRVFTKRQIFVAVWEEEADYSFYDNTVMVYISKLRDKIEDDPKNPQYIRTVRGLGYKFEIDK